MEKLLILGHSKLHSHWPTVSMQTIQSYQIGTFRSKNFNIWVVDVVTQLLHIQYAECKETVEKDLNGSKSQGN